MQRLAERPRRYKCLFYQWCGPETGSSSSATGWGVRDGANHLPYRVLGYCLDSTSPEDHGEGEHRNCHFCQYANGDETGSH